MERNSLTVPHTSAQSPKLIKPRRLLCTGILPHSIETTGWLVGIQDRLELRDNFKTITICYETQIWRRPADPKASTDFHRQRQRPGLVVLTGKHI